MNPEAEFFLFFLFHSNFFYLSSYHNMILLCYHQPILPKGGISLLAIANLEATLAPL